MGLLSAILKFFCFVSDNHSYKAVAPQTQMVYRLPTVNRTGDPWDELSLSSQTLNYSSTLSSERSTRHNSLRSQCSDVSTYWLPPNTLPPPFERVRSRSTQHDSLRSQFSDSSNFWLPPNTLPPPFEAAQPTHHSSAHFCTPNARSYFSDVSGYLHEEDY